MKKKRKTGEYTEADKVYFHVEKVIQYLRSSLKMEYAYVGLVSNVGVDRDRERTLLRTVKGLEYVRDILFDFLRNGDTLKQILEAEKKEIGKKAEYPFLR